MTVHAAMMAVALAAGGASGATVGATGSTAVVSDGLRPGGASLGMSKSAWLALVRAQDRGGTLSVACSPPPPQGGQPASSLCHLSERDGSFDLPHATPLASGFYARDSKYLFVGDRLRKIEFESSIDSFNRLAALYDSRLGHPVSIRRDVITYRSGPARPRVRLTWRKDGVRVEMVDPSQRPGKLQVDLEQSATGGAPAVAAP